MRIVGFIPCGRLLLGVAIFFLVLMLPPIPSTLGQEVRDSILTRGTLKGLTAVSVFVGLDEDVAFKGSSWNIIQNDIELRLRKAGINVSPSASSVLAICIDLYKVRPNNLGRSYNIQVALYQWVELSRDSRISSMANTWEVSALGSIPTLDSTGLSYIRSSVVPDLVDHFINAYLEQNPKP